MPLTRSLHFSNPGNHFLQRYFFLIRGFDVPVVLRFVRQEKPHAAPKDDSEAKVETCAWGEILKGSVKVRAY